jgi:hypothetical protein
MQNIQTLKDYDYVGALADVCRNFVAEKRATGLKYETPAKKLNQMCRESLNYDISANTLPENFVRAWIAKKPHETEGNRHSRYNAVRSLAQYMKRLGYDAFCPEKEDVGKYSSDFIPYIFTHDEIQRFFAASNVSAGSARTEFQHDCFVPRYIQTSAAICRQVRHPS